jgi:cobalt-zinc-cadmium efflux system membrane fusion protein
VREPDHAMAVGKKTITLWAVAAVAVASFAGVAYFVTPTGDLRNGAQVTANATATNTGTDSAASRAPSDTRASESIDLSEKDVADVRTEPVGERAFPIEKTAVGSIDFNQDMTVQVFAPYAGRIVSLSAQLGDEVAKGQVLFTLDSPDLVQAASTLISAASVLELTSRNLARLKGLYETRAVSQKNLEQAVSDQQTAEGALRGARDAIRMFGKTDADMDRMIKERKVDSILVVHCPVPGKVSERNAAPGLYVQPGNPPSPYSVSDVSTMWLLANVAESDAPAFRVGQPLIVKVSAYPDHAFEGRVTTIGLTVDQNTRRVLVRSEINDPRHELWAGMFANFVIQVGPPVRSLAVPSSGVVREGDGTMTVWVATDRRRFTKRTVKTGLQNEGYHQILDGLRLGELVVTKGARFLNNALATATR